MPRFLAAVSLMAILLAPTAAPARTTTTMHSSGGVGGGHHHALAGNRFIVVSHAGFNNRVLLFDRFSRRFFSVGHHQFDHFHGVNDWGGWGGWGWWGWDGWTGGAVMASAEPPAGEFGALPSRPPRPPAELPPCHEKTAVGVVIERGSGCAH
jgi:hypothetical protein